MLAPDRLRARQNYQMAAIPWRASLVLAPLIAARLRRAKTAVAAVFRRFRGIPTTFAVHEAETRTRGAR